MYTTNFLYNSKLPLLVNYSLSCGVLKDSKNPVIRCKKNIRRLADWVLKELSIVRLAGEQNVRYMAKRTAARKAAAYNAHSV